MPLLRPQFTQTLLETLKKQSINVHGDYGQGQTRLLDDLNSLAREQGFIVLSVDMKRWTEDYEGLIKTLCQQLRSQLPAVTETSDDFAQLSTALDHHAETKTVLLMLQPYWIIRCISIKNIPTFLNTLTVFAIKQTVCYWRLLPNRTANIVFMRSIYKTPHIWIYNCMNSKN